MRRARMRVRRLAATRNTAPRQVLSRVAPRDDDFLPRHAEHFSGDALRVAERLGAEVADAGLDVHLAVRLDHEQPVEADRAGDEHARRDAVAAHFRSLAFAALRLALVPAEQLRTAIERLFHECAGRMRPLPARVGRAEQRLAFGCVDPVNRHLIDA